MTNKTLFSILFWQKSAKCLECVQAFFFILIKFSAESLFKTTSHSQPVQPLSKLLIPASTFAKLLQVVSRLQLLWGPDILRQDKKVHLSFLAGLLQWISLSFSLPPFSSHSPLSPLIQVTRFPHASMKASPGTFRGRTTSLWTFPPQNCVSSSARQIHLAWLPPGCHLQLLFFLSPAPSSLRSVLTKWFPVRNRVAKCQKTLKSALTPETSYIFLAFREVSNAQWENGATKLSSLLLDVLFHMKIGNYQYTL